MSQVDFLRDDVASAFFSRFHDLTETQKDSIPLILSGLDTLIISGTGSGKTEALLAPLISRLYDEIRQSDQVQIIYVAPTKALVNDIAKRVTPALELLEIGVTIRHGDNNQLRLKRKHSVLITTPESLEVLLATNLGVLSEVKALVIDEAHLLFNQQRGMQLAFEISRIEKLNDRRLQVIAASATVSSPNALWTFFRQNANFALSHQPGHREIRHQVRLGYDYADLVSLIARIPTDFPVKILIFSDTKRECDAIALKLQESSIITASVFSHHASLSPEVRKQVEKDFNESPHAICVATSTLELGIDIGDINLVVLWGRARNWQSFMQRIGRGNRRSNYVEVICVLPAETQTKLSELIGYQALLSQVENGNFPTQESFELYGVLCQQICVVVSANESQFTSVKDFYDLVTMFSFIDLDSLRDLFLHLSELGLLIKHPVRMAFGPTEKLYDLRDKDLLWSNIPHSSSTVPVVLGSSIVGNLTSSNLFSLNIGSVFAFSAKRLKVIALQSGQIRVSETSEVISSRLKFGGMPIPVDVSLLAALRDYLVNQRYCDEQNVYPKKISTEYSIELQELFKNCDLRSDIPFFREKGLFCYITFGGQFFNLVVSKYFGISTNAATDFIIVSNKELDFSILPSSMSDFVELVHDMNFNLGARTVYQDFLTSRLQSREKVSRWLSEGHYQDTLKILKSGSAREIPCAIRFSWS